MGKPSRGIVERHQENVESFRCLVDSGSPRIVRGEMDGGAAARLGFRLEAPSIGDRKGTLTVTGYFIGGRGGLEALIVKCDCLDQEYRIQPNPFKGGRTSRCSVCGHAAASVSKTRTHGYGAECPDVAHRSRLLARITGIIRRCRDPKNTQFHHYGGRGIDVYEPWVEDKRQFLRYLVTLDNWDVPEFELDRINNEQGYVPGNLRFVSRSENLRNRRKVSEMQARIFDLEARLRHCKCGATQQVHGVDEGRTLACA